MKTKEIDNKSSYINLLIGSESFAISVYKVLEIIQYEQLTRVPNTSDYMPGVLNFRGTIVPVIDMHKCFNVEKNKIASKMIVVVELKNQSKNELMGMLVDQVTNVIEFESKSIKPVPDLGNKFKSEFLEGFIEIDGKFIMVLNIDKVLSVQEMEAITEPISASIT